MLNLHAAICRFGHVVSRDIAHRSPPESCPSCGVTVLIACLDCGEPLRGPAFTLAAGAEGQPLRRVFAIGGFERPESCHRCGESHPWMFV